MAAMLPARALSSMLVMGMCVCVDEAVATDVCVDEAVGGTWCGAGSCLCSSSKHGARSCLCSMLRSQVLRASERQRKREGGGNRQVETREGGWG